MTSIAEHRPALGKRRYSHDTLTAVDLFSGFGGLTKGIQRAGFEAISSAIHWSTGMSDSTLSVRFATLGGRADSQRAARRAGPLWPSARSCRILFSWRLAGETRPTE